METASAVKIVNPDTFRVPYAINEDDSPFDIKDLIERREVPDEDFLCPVCGDRVFFVRETDKRSAHFRHQTTSNCDRIAAERAQTIHNRVVQVTARMIQSGVALADICIGHKKTGQDLPSGEVHVEKSYTIDGQRYQPDISISPQEGQIAPIFELEVVLTHRPEKERVKLAAEHGRVVACINIAKLQQYYDTAKRLESRTGRSFDVDKMCFDYVMNTKFFVMLGANVRQGLREFVNNQREYMRANKAARHGVVRVAPKQSDLIVRRVNEGNIATVVQHGQHLPHEARYGVSPGGRPITWDGKVVSRQAWSQLTEWQKHGPDGRVWSGQNKLWERA